MTKDDLRKALIAERRKRIALERKQIWLARLLAIASETLEACNCTQTAGLLRDEAYNHGLIPMGSAVRRVLDDEVPF